jgi:pyruvate formate lyase activating enzyme
LHGSFGQPRAIRPVSGALDLNTDSRPVQGRVARIARSAMHDGPGLRTVVFFKGCPLRCRWCHSPETQAFGADVLLLKDRCIACRACVEACTCGAARLARDGPAVDRARCEGCGRCAERCPACARDLQGGWMTVGAVMDAVGRDLPFYERSGGGVTFSGGEPLHQSTFLSALLDRCRADGIPAAIETCGHASRRAALRALDRGPLFLYDIKIVDEARHREVTGASNARILANLATLAARRADLVVRFPVVPGITDDEANVAAVGRLAASLGVARIDVLAYHRAGLAKYERLNQVPGAADVPAATAADAERAAARLRGFGLDVRVGGAS